MTVLGVLAALLAVGAAVLFFQARSVQRDLTAARQELTTVEKTLKDGKFDETRAPLQRAGEHSSAARRTSSGPLWRLTAMVPKYGRNIAAVTTVAQATDAVVKDALPILVDTAGQDPNHLLAPKDGRIDVEGIRALARPLREADGKIKGAVDRVTAIDPGALDARVAAPVRAASRELSSLRDKVRLAADVTEVAPAMLGADGPRHYVLLFQNNAEARATGGMPGAMALIRADRGVLSLVRQKSAVQIGVSPTPVLPLTQEQEQLYTNRPARFPADVNFTPDFATTGALVREMWRRSSAASGGEELVDGVMSIDPVAVSYLIGATGPVTVQGQVLDSRSLTPIILNQVYLKERDLRAQDAFFAEAARVAFDRLTKGASGAGMVPAMERAAGEGRLLLWSAHPQEQDLLAGMKASGPLPERNSPSAARSLGVFLNDGTGSKMSYYLTAKLTTMPVCGRSDQYVAEYTLTSTAPPDAATLPPSVTGGGNYGVPPGMTRTQVLVFFPERASLRQVSVPVVFRRDLDRMVLVMDAVNGPGQQWQVRMLLQVEPGDQPLASVHTPMAHPVEVVDSTTCGSF